MAVILISALEATSGEGTHWKSYEATSPYRQVIYVPDESVADSLDRFQDADLWAGVQVSPQDFEPVLDAPALMTFAQEPKEGFVEEFNDWMDTEHLPILTGLKGTLSAARFEAVSGSPRYCAIYYVSDPEHCSSEIWRNAAATPWTLRMRRNTHNKDRGIYVRS